jgi:hypothetical protein
MVSKRVAWLAVVGESVARILARDGWRVLPLIESSRRPAPGDRIVVVLARRARPIVTALVLGTADVREAETGDVADVRIRHRVIAPARHEPRLTDVPALLRRVGWTDDRLLALLGSLDEILAPDLVRVEAALRSAALAFGPAPRRQSHSRPRTPGRRRLATARIAARRGTSG